MYSTTELLTKLNSLRPVTEDVTSVNAAVQFMKDYLNENGIFTEIQELGTRQVLYASTVDINKVTVLLNAHLDVVPADDRLFQVIEKNGWLYGRGTYDCLGNAAIVANTLIRLKDKAAVGAVFSTDEEIGGSTTAYMAERCSGVEKLVCVLDGEGGALTVAQKGVMAVKLKAEGRACHAAEPWDGINALDRLIDGYQKVRDIFPPASENNQWQNTMAATIIRAGNAHNRVPESAELTLNIRYTEPGDNKAILDELKTRSGLDAEVLMECDPVAFDAATPVLAELLDHMHHQLKQEIDVIRLNGATDARHFVKLGVPVAIIGVNGRDMHSDGECAELKSIRSCEEMLVSFVASL